MLTIFHAPRSRSNRVVWLCEELGVAYETVSLKLGEKPADLLEKNPGGTVPLLVDGEVVLFESITMLEYIAETRNGGDLVVGADEPDHWIYREMLLWGEATLAGPLNALIGTLFTAPDQKDNVTATMIRGAFDKRIKVVSKRLAHGDYMAAGRFTLADISVAYGVGLAKALNAMGAGLVVPDVAAAYFERLSSREAYRRMVAVK